MDPMGEVRHAADIPVSIAGNKGEFPALALEADIPGLLRKGASDALGGQFGGSKDTSTLRRVAGRKLRGARIGWGVVF